MFAVVCWCHLWQSPKNQATGWKRTSASPCFLFECKKLLKCSKISNTHEVQSPQLTCLKPFLSGTERRFQQFQSDHNYGFVESSPRENVFRATCGYLEESKPTCAKKDGSERRKIKKEDCCHPGESHTCMFLGGKGGTHSVHGGWSCTQGQRTYSGWCNKWESAKATFLIIAPSCSQDRAFFLKR